MKKSLLLLLLITATLAFSCKKDNDNNTNSKFQGSWSGNYSGGDKGSIAVDIDSKGILKGTSISSNTLEMFEITGTVDANGVFKGSTNIGTNFTGTFTQSSVSGSWNNASLKLSGTWIGSKE